MAETAAHLVDHVIPRVPVRQWVVSFPHPMRRLFATHPQLLSLMLQVITRALSSGKSLNWFYLPNILCRRRMNGVIKVPG